MLSLSLSPQWRKVHLVHELIRESGRQYSLILRARPDATILEPFDLRALECDYGARASVRAAKGHWISVPERSMQVWFHQVDTFVLHLSSWDSNR